MVRRVIFQRERANARGAGIGIHGAHGLPLPAWTQAALGANERLKLYLRALQAVAVHAEHPECETLDLTTETGVAQGDASWLRGLPATASRVDGALRIPDLQRLVRRLSNDLGVIDVNGHRMLHRLGGWQGWLTKLHGYQLASEQLRSLTRSVRAEGCDSFHLRQVSGREPVRPLTRTR